jgi:TonB family protein
MKNYILIFAILISFKLSGQSDTTIYYSEKGDPVPEINQASYYEKLLKVKKDKYLLSSFSKRNDKWQPPYETKIKRLSDSSYLMTSNDNRIRIYQKTDSGFIIKDFIKTRLIQIGSSKLIFPLVRYGLWKSFDPSSGSIQEERIFLDNKIITNKYWINDSKFIKDTFRQAEVPPEFKGGTDALFSFIGRNINYPDHLKQKRIQGRVVVGFIITTDGELVVTKVLNNADPSLAEEAIRVVNLTQNKWTPGKIGKENVNTLMMVPITFTLK